MDKLPTLTKKLLLQGELFDEDFINAGICDYGGETMKNSLVIYRRRSCLLTCPALIAREVAKYEAAQKKKDLTAERKKASEIKKRKREEEAAAA